MARTADTLRRLDLQLATVAIAQHDQASRRLASSHEQLEDLLKREPRWSDPNRRLADLEERSQLQSHATGARRGGLAGAWFPVSVMQSLA